MDHIDAYILYIYNEANNMGHHANPVYSLFHKRNHGHSTKLFCVVSKAQKLQYIIVLVFKRLFTQQALWFHNIYIVLFVFWFSFHILQHIWKFLVLLMISIYTFCSTKSFLFFYIFVWTIMSTQGNNNGQQHRNLHGIWVS